jgi:hypothetical protein
MIAITLAIAFLAQVLNQLRTNAGTDWQAGVMGNPASTGTGGYAPAAYFALSTTDADPQVTDTALGGEITTGSLARAVGVFAHTVGANSYTLTKVFTSDQVAHVYRGGLFNAPSGGTLVWASRLDEDAPLKPGDSIQLTQVVSF